MMFHYQSKLAFKWSLKISESERLSRILPDSVEVEAWHILSDLNFSADIDVKLNILDSINSRLLSTEDDPKTLIRILVAFGTLISQVKKICFKIF